MEYKGSLQQRERDYRTWNELKVVNYYAPIANQYGMLNWYGSF